MARPGIFSGPPRATGWRCESYVRRLTGNDAGDVFDPRRSGRDRLLRAALISIEAVCQLAGDNFRLRNQEGNCTTRTHSSDVYNVRPLRLSQFKGSAP